MSNNIALLLVAVVALLLLMGIGGLAVPATGLLAALLINSLIGILILWLLNFIGIHIPINIVSLLVVLVLGLAGVIILCLLAFFDIYGGMGRPAEM